MRSIAAGTFALVAMAVAPSVAGAQAAAPQTIAVCAITVPTTGKLDRVDATYDARTGDTTVVAYGMRVRFRAAYPTGTTYALDHMWYVNNQSIRYSGGTYAKYGLPRVLDPSEVRPSAFFGTVPSYVEAGSTGVQEVIYIPVRPGCEFQPYQRVP